jgi:WD40 repeat protein
LRSWDLWTGKEVGRISLPFIGFSVAPVPDGKHLLLGGSGGNVAFVDPMSGKITRRFSGHSGEVRAVGVSRNGQFVISGSNDGTIRYWDATTGEELYRFSGLGGTVCTRIEFSPEGRIAASVHQDKLIRVWGLPGGKGQIPP